MTLRAYGDKVIVEVLSDEEVTPGGLLLNSAVIERRKVLKCRVIATGDGPIVQNRHVGSALKAGDTILVPREKGWPLNSIEFSGEVIALREDPEFILGVVQ